MRISLQRSGVGAVALLAYLEVFLFIAGVNFG